MKASEILYYAPINETDNNKVSALMESMREHGYVGCPILVYNGELLTGSHRLEALIGLADEDDEVLDWEVAEDVTDIVESNIARCEEENGWAPDIAYDNIGWLLEGSWVEEYRDEIEEW